MGNNTGTPLQLLAKLKAELSHGALPNSNFSVQVSALPNEGYCAHLPKDMQESLADMRADTPLGCGGCAHSEWIVCAQQPSRWVVGQCRAGIKLCTHSETVTPENRNFSTTTQFAGFSPTVVCSAQNCLLPGSLAKSEKS